MANPRWQSGNNDDDGNAFLGGSSILHVNHIDPIGSFFNPTTENHYGAAADGQFYWDGEATAQSTDFEDRKAWNLERADPFGLSNPAGVPDMAILGSSLTFSGSFTSGNKSSPGVHSWLKWLLSGDFDIQIEFDSYNAISGIEQVFELGVVKNLGGGIGDNSHWISRGKAQGGYDTYFERRWTNGVYADWREIPTVTEATGKLRLTRVGALVTPYYWSGGAWVAHAAGGNSPVNVEEVFVWIRTWGDGSEIECRLFDFAINSGTVVTTAGWYREAFGAHRGNRSDFPSDAVAVCTDDSVDIIDADNDKLWMRFDQDVNHLLHSNDGAQNRPLKTRWDNGILAVAYSRDPDSVEGGGAIVVDFVTDLAKQHRNSTATASYYDELVTPGAIPYRNSNLVWQGTDSEWNISDHRVQDFDMVTFSGYQLSAIAGYLGMTYVQWRRLYFLDSPRLQKATSTESNKMLWCKLTSAGNLFYMDSTNVYFALKATLDAALGGTFTADYQEALPGTQTIDAQYTAAVIGSDMYMAADEGIYKKSWPSGSFELWYGKPGSGAAYEIIPALSPTFDRVATIETVNDGDDDVLVFTLSETTTPRYYLAVISPKFNDLVAYKEITDLSVNEAIGVDA